MQSTYNYAADQHYQRYKTLANWIWTHEPTESDRLVVTPSKEPINPEQAFPRRLKENATFQRGLFSFAAAPYKFNLFFLPLNFVSFSQWRFKVSQSDPKRRKKNSWDMSITVSWEFLSSWTSCRWMSRHWLTKCWQESVKIYWPDCFQGDWVLPGPH